jgi:Outer membrane protein beta-barrel domain
MKILAFSLITGICSSGSLLLGQESSKFTFEVGAGFTESLGSTRTVLAKTGWNIEGGAGYRITKDFGVNLDVAYNSFGINGFTLGEIGVPGGNVNIFSATVDPIYHFAPFHHINAYVTGGGGFYHQYQDLTEPTLVNTFYGNPFFGFYPGAGVGTAVLSSYSVNKPGYDLGGGFEVGTKYHGKIFAEAKYNHMFNSDSHTDYIATTFGFRW